MVNYENKITGEIITLSEYLELDFFDKRNFVKTDKCYTRSTTRNECTVIREEHSIVEDMCDGIMLGIVVDSVFDSCSHSSFDCDSHSSFGGFDGGDFGGGGCGGDW